MSKPCRSCLPAVISANTCIGGFTALTGRPPLVLLQTRLTSKIAMWFDRLDGYAQGPDRTLGKRELFANLNVTGNVRSRRSSG